ncbi:hypothetical protein [Streptomyces sp. LN549]|uniref:hypothetical protein n=1 Tax=Streptomyces sp. LN549 TaxID=3112979 RepID=UPI003723B33E
MAPPAHSVGIASLALQQIEDDLTATDLDGQELAAIVCELIAAGTAFSTFGTGCACARATPRSHICGRVPSSSGISTI